MYSDRFSYENMISIYQNIKNKKLTTGIDRITKKHYDMIYEKDLKIVSDKILRNAYKPTPYKEILLLKNRNSKPRMLSLPTIRDKVILEILKNILKETCDIEKDKLPDLIDKISLAMKSKAYDSYIKLDIKGYYDNINHNILMKLLKSNIKDKVILNLIKIYLKNITITDAQPNTTRSKVNKKGVPQGISISNNLGEIYLKSFDKYFKELPNCSYFRYVDDILIFCKFCDLENIKYEAQNLLKSESYRLKASNEKCECGLIIPFDFLGYHFYEGGKIGIAKKNINKLELSLEKIFSDFHTSHDKRIKNNFELLKWKIDFRITGCFKDGRRYGWVIFFYQNQILSTFYHFDWLIVQLSVRYGLSDKLILNNKYKGKKFVKTYHEFINRQDNSEYIPNIDKFTNEMKRDVLIRVCKRKESYVNSLNDYLLENVFNKFIFSTISDIEKDLYQIYT